MTTTAPLQGLSDAAFAALMAASPPRFPWAVAVSGGADSVALMVLCARWAAREEHPRPLVLTVDHGLRPEAARDAESVARWAASYGLDCEILRWQGHKPETGLQAAARRARYRLLGAACRSRGITCLLTAHTEEDQAETFLLRLGRGSGVTGLSAMAPRAPLPDPDYRDIELVRPLLTVSRSRLRETLRRAGQEWIDDPSNEDSRFARVRMRRLLPLLAEQGLTPRQLAATAARLGRARQALEVMTDQVCAQAARFDPAGYVRLEGSALCAAPEEVGLRVLARLLKAVSGAVYPPRLQRLERLYACLVARGARGGSAFRGATLAGCRVISTGRDGSVLITREWRALNRHQKTLTGTVSLCGASRLVWDNRFEVCLEAPAGPGGLEGEVRALGRSGWQVLRADLDQGRAICDPAALPPHRVPAAVRPTLPALWVGDDLAAVPHFGAVRPHVLPSSLPAGALKMTARFHPEWAAAL